MSSASVPPSADATDVSARLLLAIRDYAAMKLEPESARATFEEAVTDAGTPLSSATDPRAWVPLDTLAVVHDAFVDALGPDFMVDATTWAIPARRDLSSMSVSALTTPDLFYASLDRARSFFARHVRFEMRRVGRGRYDADLLYREGVPRRGPSCAVGRGVLVAVPLLFDLPPAVVRETACYGRGAERCSYEITFAAPRPLGLYGALVGALVGGAGALALPDLGWLFAPLLGWLCGREVDHMRARGLMARVTEEQRRALLENEADFQRRFDELEALRARLAESAPRGGEGDGER